MACNCATSEQVNRLYKKYGERRKGRKLPFRQRVKNAVVYGGVAAAMVLITPFLFLYVLYKAFGDDDHRISLTKFFRLDKKKGIEYAG